jgi:hypothetical protein
MTPNGGTIGATGGAQSSQLITANLPPYTPSGTITLSSGGSASGQFLNNVATAGSGTMFNGGSSTPLSSNPSYSFNGAAQGGTSTSFINVPPMILMQKVIYAGV